MHRPVALEPRSGPSPALPRLPGRPAIVSHVLPPSPSGQAVVLGRLLSGFARDSYCLLSREDYSRPLAWHPREGELLPRLDATYYHLADLRHLHTLLRPLPFRLRQGAGTTLQLLHRAQCILRLLKRERCGALLAASGDLIDLPASHLASRLAGIPLCAYLFDDYVGQWPLAGHRAFARRAEAALMRTAAAVVVPNAALAELIRQRTGRNPAIVPNPASEVGPAAPCGPRLAGRAKRIVYTGAIYGAQLDAFANLGAALARLGRPEISLHAYTWQDPEKLRRLLPALDITFHPHVTGKDLVAALEGADLLFLGLAFDSEIPDAIRTASPAKMSDYLASGRPILAHVPAASFVADYFRHHQCGWLVDRLDPAALASAISGLLDDRLLAAETTRRAAECHVADFLLAAARQRLAAVLESVRGGERSGG
jgi:glycosyltransferase involved in cell wall biosynthesis